MPHRLGAAIILWWVRIGYRPTMAEPLSPHAASQPPHRPRDRGFPPELLAHPPTRMAPTDQGRRPSVQTLLTAKLRKMGNHHEELGPTDTRRQAPAPPRERAQRDRRLATPTTVETAISRAYGRPRLGPVPLPWLEPVTTSRPCCPYPSRSPPTSSRTAPLPSRPAAESSTRVPPPITCC
jgi:hypothetical protein